jgi:hypothetical protein
MAKLAATPVATKVTAKLAATPAATKVTVTLAVAMMDAPATQQPLSPAISLPDPAGNE